MSNPPVYSHKSPHVWRVVKVVLIVAPASPEQHIKLVMGVAHRLVEAGHLVSVVYTVANPVVSKAALAMVQEPWPGGLRFPELLRDPVLAMERPPFRLKADPRVAVVLPSASGDHLDPAGNALKTAITSVGSRLSWPDDPTPPDTACPHTVLVVAPLEDCALPYRLAASCIDGALYVWDSAVSDITPLAAVHAGLRAARGRPLPHIVVQHLDDPSAERSVEADLILHQPSPIRPGEGSRGLGAAWTRLISSPHAQQDGTRASHRPLDKLNVAVTGAATSYLEFLKGHRDRPLDSVIRDFKNLMDTVPIPWEKALNEFDNLVQRFQWDRPNDAALVLAEHLDPLTDDALTQPVLGAQHARLRINLARASALLANQTQDAAARARHLQRANDQLAQIDPHRCKPSDLLEYTIVSAHVGLIARDLSQRERLCDLLEHLGELSLNGDLLLKGRAVIYRTFALTAKALGDEQGAQDDWIRALLCCQEVTPRDPGYGLWGVAIALAHLGRFKESWACLGELARAAPERWPKVMADHDLRPLFEWLVTRGVNM